MADIEVTWGTTASEKTTVSSLEELDHILDNIHDTNFPKHPILVTISGLHSHFIFLGLGSSESILVLQNLKPGKEGWTTEYISTGDKDPTENCSFWLHGEHHSEFPGQYIIPTTLARQIIREYHHEHELPDTIEWDTHGF
jgi:hypothetical protein